MPGGVKQGQQPNHLPVIASLQKATLTFMIFDIESYIEGAAVPSTSRYSKRLNVATHIAFAYIIPQWHYMIGCA